MVNTVPIDERHDPYCIAPEAATELLSQAPWQRFVVLGDDFARGPAGSCTGYTAASWADRLAAALRSVRPDLAYLNLAQSDVTAAQVRARQLARALTFRADLAAVAAGGSDLLRDGFDADATEAELARIIGPLRDSGVEVVVLAPFGRGHADAVLAGRRTVPPQRLLSERIHDLALRNGALRLDLGAHPAASSEDTCCPDGRRISARAHAIAAAAAIHRLAARLGVAERRDGGQRTARAQS
jgi:hypothetical protein